MILNHPNYEGLKIYVGDQPPIGGGYFYSPSKGKTLSHIALFAYGSGMLSPGVLRINKSEWNRLNCVYRKKSTSCLGSVSPRVDSALAMIQNNWNDGAWLALCPKDTQVEYASLGILWPVLWVPTALGEEPGDLAVIPTPGGKVENLPGIGGGVQDNPGRPVDDPSRGDLDRGDTSGGPGGGVTIEDKGGFPWGWIALAAVVGIGGYAYYKGKQGYRKPVRAR